jgi:hypothetical protein
MIRIYPILWYDVPFSSTQHLCDTTGQITIRNPTFVCARTGQIMIRNPTFVCVMTGQIMIRNPTFVCATTGQIMIRNPTFVRCYNWSNHDQKPHICAGRVVYIYFPLHTESCSFSRPRKGTCLIIHFRLLTIHCCRIQSIHLRHQTIHPRIHCLLHNHHAALPDRICHHHLAKGDLSRHIFTMCVQPATCLSSSSQHLFTTEKMTVIQHSHQLRNTHAQGCRYLQAGTTVQHFSCPG